MTKAELAAYKAYPYETGTKGLICKNSRQIFIRGYEQAEKDITDLFESRLAEILGDAQPTSILRIELRELIDKIKEQ